MPAASARRLLLAGAYAALGAAAPIGVITQWSCAPQDAAELAKGARWTKLLCNGTGVPLFGAAGPDLVVNVVVAEISQGSGLRLAPLRAQADASGFFLAPLDSIAQQEPRAVAGINGGYFFRSDLGKNWVDGVCLGKDFADAAEAPSPTSPNAGPADGTIVSGGVLLGSNCNCSGYSRPVILTIDGAASRFDVLHRGAAPPQGLALDAVGSSPNLVSSNASGSFVDIPSDDDNIGNILEHAANTAVGLRPSADGSGGVEAVLVTTDGYDGCSPFNATCGTNAFTLAYLMKDFFNATSAMNMDQGGSTTMWVKGQANDGIVSSSGSGTRAINSGLFVVAA
jgi:hypothetical protein